MSSKSKKQKGIEPKRRFPEFRSASKWGVKSLGELANRVNDRNKNSYIERVFTNSAVSGVVDQRDYFDKDIANKGNLENYFIIEQGDYVYNPRISTVAPVGPISKNKIGKGIMSPLYTVFRFKNPNNVFYEHYFKSDNWYGYIKEASNTGARFDRVSITNDQFMGLPLPHPLPAEQQKIADCLSSLDELIEADDAKLDALKQHKKGLMRELFPAEGETLPSRRFPEFKNASEWETKTVGSICKETFSGGTPATTEKNYYGGKIPFIRSAEIGKTSTELFLTEEGLSNSAAKMVCKGDVLVALYGANSGDVALSKIDGAINQAVLCLRSNCNEFIYQFLAHKKIWIVSKYIQGGQGNLSGEIVKSIKLTLPKEPKEQKRITDFLSSIDDLITAQSQKVDALRQHKKGLMQQLFPSLAELKA